ncbi:HNH endonuclease [Hypnocyclicus thermotrophus]|uniref:HNH endonuclease n=1 Tax=Hypnocyclicus thermotrophus TaxID=1627895 RepID=A0AA46DZI9_9FUSO|nr:HNH endonuclease [Hypnocyclicus thermotrophus]TDT71824.1 HNH endonuclease [Hypnocyclicus thermotrophus]
MFLIIILILLLLLFLNYILKNNNNSTSLKTYEYTLNHINNKKYRNYLDKSFNKNDKEYIFNLFNNKCFNCGSTNNLEIDHHYPISKGYPLKYKNKYNAVLLCRDCNIKKSNKFPENFYLKSQLEVLKKKYNITQFNIDKQILDYKLNFLSEYILNNLNCIININQKNYLIKPLEIKYEVIFINSNLKKEYYLIYLFNKNKYISNISKLKIKSN